MRLTPATGLLSVAALLPPTARPARCAPVSATSSSQPSPLQPWQVQNTLGLEKAYISIAGLIGAGKSSLATELGRVLDVPVYYEPVADNVYLEDFYQDSERRPPLPPRPTW